MNRTIETRRRGGGFGRPRATALVTLAVVVGVLCAASPAAAVKRRIFATSTIGTGDLSTWPDGVGATAFARADAICRAAAAAATPSPLPNASTYRAWISTSTTDAFCHVQGLSGTKAFGCNLATLPGAGPWFLSNGATNFSGTLDELVNQGEIYRPVSRDENFAALPLTTRFYWTGSDANGVYTGNNCSNWGDDSPGGPVGTVGDGYRVVDRWSAEDEMACAGEHRLLCVEPGAGEESRLGWSPAAIAFVTSATGKGDLSAWPLAGGATGIEAGDTICRTLAAAAHLPSPESFLAWLSTATPQIDAVDRMTISGPWKRLDAYTIANNLADLVDSTIDTSLHVFENGSYLQDANCDLSFGCRAWTGTASDGTASTQTCNDWTDLSGSFSGTNGSVADGPLTAVWTEYAVTSCNSNQRLYCLSNRLTLFWDGFELTGDTSRWSQTVP